MVTKQTLMEIGDILPEVVEDIVEQHKDGVKTFEIVLDLYNSELNFNNADITSGQRVWTESEITKIVNKVINDIPEPTHQEIQNVIEDNNIEYEEQMRIEGDF